MKLNRGAAWGIVVSAVLSVCAGCAKREEAHALYRKGNELYASQNLEDALFCFQKSTSLDSRRKQSSVMAAKCLYYLGREREAALLLEEVLERFPDYIDAHYWLAKVSYFQSQYEKAEAHLLAVVEGDASHLDARMLLGDIYREEGSFEKALLNYSMIDANLDMIAVSKINKARIFASSKQYDRALEELGFVTRNAGDLNLHTLDAAYELLSQIPTDE